MFVRAKRSAATLAIALLTSGLLTGCDRSITDPSPRRDIRSTQLSQHDDDPADCRSGYTLVGGHVVCN
jgi:hypothetical protein